MWSREIRNGPLAFHSGCARCLNARDAVFKHEDLGALFRCTEEQSGSVSKADSSNPCGNPRTTDE